MRTPRAEPAALEDRQVPVQTKIAAAWTSFVLLYVYVDIFGFYLPGVVDDILVGIVWEFDINQIWVTSALALVAGPILMVALSMTLPARVNRATNLVVASVYVPVSVLHAVGESWRYYFTLAIGLEVLVLLFILRLAWTWPRAATPAVPGREVARLQHS
jgi:hypothetical protein